MIYFIRFISLLTISIGLTHCKPEKKYKSFDDNEFINPTENTKVHIWWHWVEGEVSKQGITKDLEAMQKQGIVQATILNVGLFKDKSFSVPKVRFDSPEWYGMFQWALQEADRLGIKLGAHNCDGWNSSGGPWIAPAQSMKTFTWAKKQVEGGQKVQIKLDKPFYRENYYEDVSLLAIKTDNQSSQFQQSNPIFKLNNITTINGLADGSPTGGVTLINEDFVTVELSKPIKASRMAIVSYKPFSWSDPTTMEVGFNLYYSKDGKNYKKATNASFVGINKVREASFDEVEAKYFKIDFSNFPWADSWFSYGLAELELLSENETAFCNPAISNILEKSVNIKSTSISAFDSDTTFLNNQTGIKETINISKYLDAEGNLNWDAPAGKWNVIRFGFTTTGVKNAPATKEGEGLECDKMDSNVVAYHFSKFPQKLIDKAGKYTGNTFKFLLLDSWECGFQNWTKNFPQEFEKRRGYTLETYLPVLCGEYVNSQQLSEAFLYDYRATIADMIEDNYYKYFAKLCHNNKLEMHAEVIYGGGTYPPIDVLRANQYADMPMSEFWAGNNGKTSYPEYTPVKRLPIDFPPSAALFYDKSVYGAEAYTGFAHYSESPWDLKCFGDKAFATGINQMILHSYVHQPTDSAAGMTLGDFAAHFNRNNPWFNFAESWMQFHARTQFMLRQGQLQGDILYYIGDQFPQSLEAANAIMLPQGFQMHLANYDILLNKLNLKNGKLSYKNTSFAMLIIPSNMGMEIATLERIEQLVKEGMILYGQKPLKPLSVKGLQQIEKFNTLTSKIWGGTGNPNEISYGKGKVIWAKDVQTAIANLKLQPDFKSVSNDTISYLYTHRVLPNQDIYFVANQEDKEKAASLFFRTSYKHARLYDATTGEISAVKIAKSENGMTEIVQNFKPKESILIVFSNAPNTSKFPLKTIASQALNIKGKLTFKNAKITPISIDKLLSWTENTNDSIKYFSGAAQYSIKFDVSTQNLSNKNNKLYLDMGKIGETAQVKLNGQNLGTVWLPNTRFEVTNLLKTSNVIEVTVGNLNRNRILGDFKTYGELKNIWTSVDIKQRLNKDMELKPAGWLGPLLLITKE